MSADAAARPRIAITGGFGFLGWHTACRLRALHGITPVRLGRKDLANPDTLRDLLSKVDGVIHIAGVNRADSDDEVEKGNIRAAEGLAAAVHDSARGLPISYANSIQAEQGTPYGQGKAAAAAILESVTDGQLADVLLPNLFGEHGRPAYNSFVATFAHEFARDHEPNVTGDRQVPLLHVQSAAAELINGVLKRHFGKHRPVGELHHVSEVRDRLADIHRLYRTGEIPPLLSEFDVDLFNTYRSYAFPQRYPIEPQIHADTRGTLFEAVRSHGGSGQAFVSTTLPRKGRGDHYHLRKIERFMILKGEAEVNLRRLLHDEVITFRLSGKRPALVDMPTLWVHNLRNVGDDELVMIFWSDQLLDPQRPDQHAEMVTPDQFGDQS